MANVIATIASVLPAVPKSMKREIRITAKAYDEFSTKLIGTDITAFHNTGNNWKINVRNSYNKMIYDEQVLCVSKELAEQAFRNDYFSKTENLKTQAQKTATELRAVKTCIPPQTREQMSLERIFQDVVDTLKDLRRRIVLKEVGSVLTAVAGGAVIYNFLPAFLQSKSIPHVALLGLGAALLGFGVYCFSRLSEIKKVVGECLGEQGYYKSLDRFNTALTFMGAAIRFTAYDLHKYTSVPEKDRDKLKDILGIKDEDSQKR